MHQSFVCFAVDDASPAARRLMWCLLRVFLWRQQYLCLSSLYSRSSWCRRSKIIQN